MSSSRRVLMWPFPEVTWAVCSRVSERQRERELERETCQLQQSNHSPLVAVVLQVNRTPSRCFLGSTVSSFSYHSIACYLPHARQYWNHAQTLSKYLKCMCIEPMKPITITVVWLKRPSYNGKTMRSQHPYKSMRIWKVETFPSLQVKQNLNLKV